MWVSPGRDQREALATPGVIIDPKKLHRESAQLCSLMLASLGWVTMKPTPIGTGTRVHMVNIDVKSLYLCMCPQN